MQHSDWHQIFEEVEREIHGLIVEQQGQVEKAFALNNGKLDVTFKVTLEEKDSTFDVSVDVSFVKEKIKSGDSKRLILGQGELPGTGADLHVDLGDGKGMRPLDLKKALKRVGKKETVEPKTCKNCHNNLFGGCDLEGVCDDQNSRWTKVGAA